MSTKVIVASFLCLLGCLSPILGISKNLGQYGHVFNIVEQNMLDFIHDRLIYLKRTGQLKQLEENAKEDVKNSVLNPKPVRLTTTNNPKTFYYTPIFTLSHSVYDIHGKIIYPKGTTVNPMDSSTYPTLVRKYHRYAPKWNKSMIFFNANDSRQVNWVNKELIKLNKAHEYYKLVMTGGNIKTASKATYSKVYFRLNGQEHQL